MKLGNEIFRSKKAASTTVHYITFGGLLCGIVLLILFFLIPLFREEGGWERKFFILAAVYVIFKLILEAVVESFKDSQNGYLIFYLDGVECVRESETTSYQWADVIDIRLSEGNPDMGKSRRQVGLTFLLKAFFTFGQVWAVECGYRVHLQLPNVPARTVEVPDFRAWLKLDETLAETLPSYERASRLQMYRENSSPRRRS